MVNYISVSSSSSYTTTSDYWSIITSNIFYNTGNVGIGVPYPKATFHIDGNASFGYNNVAPTDSLIINGNVGVGTTSPTNKLQITGGNVIVANNNPTGNASLSLYNDFSLGVVLYLNGSNQTADGGSRTATLRNDNGTLRLLSSGGTGITVLPNGNVGINQSNPQYLLDINGAYYAKGHVLQCVTVQDTVNSTWSSPASGFTLITTLNLVITPKKANSTIILQWMINGEIHNDNLFVVIKNGSIIGYNTDVGNVRYSGTVAGPYENPPNVDSTPNNFCIFWVDNPNTTSSTTYGIGVKSSGASAYTLYLNRTAGSTGQEYYENTISNGTAWEICN